MNTFPPSAKGAILSTQAVSLTRYHTKQWTRNLQSPSLYPGSGNCGSRCVLQVRADRQRDSITDIVTLIADGKNIAVQGTWERIPLIWITENDNTADHCSLCSWNESGSLVDNLSTLAVSRKKYSASWTLGRSTVDLTSHICGTSARTPHQITGNICRISAKST